MSQATLAVWLFRNDLAKLQCFKSFRPVTVQSLQILYIRQTIIGEFFFPKILDPLGI